MTRYPDWQARLEKYLASARGRKFKYGEFDCCLFVAGAIQAMTGTDLARDVRGLYGSAKQARSFCAIGGYSIGEFVVRLLRCRGLLEVPLGKAFRGDVVVFGKRPSRARAGLVSLDGNTILVATSTGIARIGRSQLGSSVKAFRV